MGAEKIVICVVYGLPGSDLTSFLNFIESEFIFLSMGCEHFICLVDININLLGVTNISRQYSALMDDFNFTQIINEPTSTSSTLIDHILVPNPTRVVSSGVTCRITAWYISDYCLYCC